MPGSTSPTSSALTPEQLYRPVSEQALGFTDTRELPDVLDPIGQDRAMQALRVATGVQARGFNAFVMAPEGAARDRVVLEYLEHKAREAQVPPDLCYVFNFDHPEQPRLLHFTAGDGGRFAQDMEQLQAELADAIPAAFESDEYKSRVEELEQAHQQRQDLAIEDLQRQADEKDVVLNRTDTGFTLTPRHDGEVLDQDTFDALPDKERERISAEIERLEQFLNEMIERFPVWRKELRDKLRALNEKTALQVVEQVLCEPREAYREHEGAAAHLEAIRQDLTSNVEAFIGSAREESLAEQILARYQANLLVDNSTLEGAPVITEDWPNVQRLLGRVMHHVQDGALVTNFTLIRAGALHRANGGYLVLDAHKILMQPVAWDALKRSLFSRCITVESLEQMVSMVSTITLEPEPAPLDIKVILVGDRILYYLLAAYDPEFSQLFKVQADFSDDMPRSAESEKLYAHLLATLGRRYGARPLDAAAVARLIEFASRVSEDSEQLTLHLHQLENLIMEANFWAGEENAETIQLSHVVHAIDQSRERAGRLRERMQEQTLREIIDISTDGEAVGQVNGLTVISLGDDAFGRPSRISATARLGTGHVIDIEREVKLGGAVHSKAVLILTSFIGARYAAEDRLALSASIAFEQSYGGVEGDSASVAETCALLSAISGLPLRQNVAVTGSMNQHGKVQAVGGINEKIEGFFDLCSARGLAERQGVLIPKSNVAHLMLDSRVVEAVSEGRFEIHAIEHVDDAIALLFGMEAGVADGEGGFPEASVNGVVQQRLRAFARHWREQKDEGGA